MFLAVFIIGILHAGDFLFTLGYIRKLSKYYKNPEIVELNYHRYFFRKGGWWIYLSFLISSTALMSMAYYIFLKSIIMYAFLAGALAMLAYINLQTVLNLERTREELIPIKED